MDFAMSKENIQPLRGGRNAAQLEVGLQAQHNPQYQEQLMLQKQQFENAIRNYNGDDPLDNYYQYIYWVEQSFPKHGHEGNFISLLEDCLGRFENDPNYQNDLRLCKLWIKYIDLQANFTELYQLLYAKRICVGCADMYKAWAYYYEASGDFKRADQVYKLGKAELAQPFQELEAAYHNFVYSAGFRMLNDGAADTRRLAEQRQALTSLQTFKSGQVGSVRVPSSTAGPGILPMNQAGFNNENRSHVGPVNVHEDFQDILFGGGAAPVSILETLKREAPKENVMEAGVWTGAVKKTHTVHKTSSIPIHIDSMEPPHERGIQLPASFVAHTREDFSQWKVPLCVPDPENPNQIPMYCKAQCYADPNKEYSIEEVRARRYMRKTKHQLSLDASANMETDIMQRSNASMECADTSMNAQQQQMNNFTHPQQMQSPHPHVSLPQQQQAIASSAPPVYAPPPKHMHPQYSQQYNPHVRSPMHLPSNMYNHAPPLQQQQLPMQVPPHMHHSMSQPPQVTQNQHYTVPSSPVVHHSPSYRVSPMHSPPRHPSPYRHVMPYEQHSIGGHPSMGPGPGPQIQHQHPSISQHQHSMNHSQHLYPAMMQPMQSPNHSYPQMHNLPPIENSAYNEPKTYTNLALQSPLTQTYQNHSAMRTIADTQQMHKSLSEDSAISHGVDMFNLWSNSDTSSPVVPIRPQQPLAHFSAYADSPTTSSWFQPQIEPKGNAMKTPIKILNDDELAETGSRGGLDHAAAAQPTDGAKRVFEEDDVDLAANTEVFNLNAMHVSTPQNKMNNENAPPPPMDHLKSTKKKLFEHQMSDIMEEASNFQSSGSAGSSSALGSGGRRSVFGVSRPGTMEPISEQSNYHFNLSQNMKANAELRLKLGMDCDSAPESPIQQPLLTSYENYEVYPAEEHYEPEVVEYDDEPQQHVPYPVLNIQPTDPFTNKVLEGFLAHVNFPGRHRRSLVRINGVPKLAVKKDPCHVGKDRYLVDKLLGKGSYGNVYKAVQCATGAVVALKIQKPANKWEFYICKEIQARLADHPLRDCFMNVHIGYFSDLASVLVSDVHNTSLLNLINMIKVNLSNAPKHHLSIHLTSEMMKIVQALHQVRIIHADIKPDNFLVMVTNDVVRLQLIDFGCSIDMSLMPEGTTFTRKVKTVSFQCCEMKDDRPWNYHTDLFCIAATSHVLLFESYIEMKKADGRWSITKKIPRYYRDDLWSTFFSSMLNMQEGLADLDYLISFFADALDPKELRSATTYIINSFKNR